MNPSTLSRRDLLKAGAAVGATSVVASALPGMSAGAATPASLNDIEHVVILMQENRPFDHYFGTLSGVRGFSDPTADPAVFYQFDPDLAQNPSGKPYILPWRFDTNTMSGQNAAGNSHAWSAQHLMWNEGLMDAFVITQRASVDLLGNFPGPPTIPLTDVGPVVMSYFTREDIPYYYELADAFTICDNYHCSVLGPTNPNRVTSMSGTIDPSGSLGGGPVIDNNSKNGSLQWETYCQRLQAAGIDWYVYQEEDNDTNNMLGLFGAFNDTTTDIYRRGMTIIPTTKGQAYGPGLIDKFTADVESGNLPQVSWILAGYLNCEHPNATPAFGQNFTNGVLQALMANPKVWAKTALILHYDENDGKFDHVTPPTAPLGTAGEYINLAKDLANPESSFGIPGPVGLGFRVPCMVLSPFSRGGLLCSDVLDHTSVLRFLERRFGVEVPYISDWRRNTVGDLTGAFNFAGGLNTSIPQLPNTWDLAIEALWQEAHLPQPVMPRVQSMPVQEPGPPRRAPSGIV
ncbi:MAG TPA: alkaline phosphatase family protein [Acidimicrobiales bacterium]